MASSQELLEIDEETKKIVFGYIHKMINKINFFLSIDIPKEIINVIMIYFYEPRDEWNNDYNESAIKIIDKYTAKCIKQTCAAVYGDKVMKPGKVFKWKIWLIEYQRNSNDHSPYIGVIKDSQFILKKRIHDLYTSLDNDGYILCSGKEKLLRPTRKIYGEPFVNIGNVMELTLNLKNFTVSYNINGTDYGIAFDNIDEHNYRLFCCLAGKGNAVQFI